MKGNVRENDEGTARDWESNQNRVKRDRTLREAPAPCEFSGIPESPSNRYPTATSQLSCRLTGWKSPWDQSCAHHQWSPRCGTGTPSPLPRLHTGAWRAQSHQLFHSDRVCIKLLFIFLKMFDCIQYVWT